MTNNKTILSEWEGLQETYEVAILKSIPGMNIKDIRSIIVFRDEEYRIKGKILAERAGAVGLYRNLKKGEPGEAVQYMRLEGSDPYGMINYKLQDCFFTNVRTNYSNLQHNPMEKVEIDFTANKVEKAYVGDMGKTGLLFEWFLNGADIPFPRSTDREYTSNISRGRHGVDEAPHIIDQVHRTQGSRDCAYIRYDDRGFILFRVPQDIGPDWSINYGIEYRKEWNIPGVEEREAIAEILGFALGTQLFGVGYTECNNDYFAIKNVSINPAGKNVMILCKEGKTSPIGLDCASIALRMEEILNSLVSGYIVMQKELELNRALWRYWVAQDMPLGTNLPVLATGLEILANAWFRSDKTTGESTYMKQSEFRELLQEELSSLTKKLVPYPLGERIVNKLLSSNYMGINEKIDKFLREINLPIGQLERAALKARNKMAHGSVLQVDNTKAIRKTLRLSRAYEVLFERVFLKILGYDGIYVDKTVTSWPVKHIDIPAGDDSVL